MTLAHNSRCQRCHYLAVSNDEPEVDLGSDCGRHDCAWCGTPAPEEGHTCHPTSGEPICADCYEERPCLNDIPREC